MERSRPPDSTRCRIAVRYDEARTAKVATLPRPLVPIFGLTQKPAKKVKACRRSAEEPVHFAEIL